MTYEWDFGDGGSTVDATGAKVRTRFSGVGVRRVTLTVTDPQGGTSTSSQSVRVWRELVCGKRQVAKRGSWRKGQGTTAYWGSYCDNRGTRKGADTLGAKFTGSQMGVVFGQARQGGSAKILIDGRKRGVIRFKGGSSSAPTMTTRNFTRLGKGRHTVRLVVTRGTAYVDGFLVVR